MIDPSERKCLLDAMERFDEAYVELRQAAARLLRILDMEAKGAGLPAVMEQPEPHQKDMRPEPSAEPVLSNGKVDPAPVAQVKAKAFGYTGDACRSCGMFMLVRVGTCVRCNGCGWDSGCG